MEDVLQCLLEFADQAVRARADQEPGAWLQLLGELDAVAEIKRLHDLGEKWIRG